ncbi:MAG: hypothetical protein MR450_06375 [Prevotella sp.]|nr:hypothetical protein [Prevotella sp.]MDY4039831.1 hypothetical protein [Prevotella sp.]
MIYLVISIVALGVVAALFELFSRNRQKVNRAGVDSTSSCAACSSSPTQCEQTCMLEAATKEIEYYDDEELDDFAGRESDSYTDDEAARFQEILNTMDPKEVAGWNRSLILRAINLPDQLKDEVVMIISENP